MAFSEALKTALRRRAHFACCLCHALGVEIHHITPLAEHGPDDETNAAPLCPSCHEIYGANPTKRKLIREARDLWYELCDRRFVHGADYLRRIADALTNVATKEDIAKLAVRNTGVDPASIRTADETGPLPYSFERDEFVHPRIVQELRGWLSDPIAPIVTVDIAAAQKSNQFLGHFSTRSVSGRTWVEWRGDRGESFAYSQLVTTPSGVRIVECRECGGGSGVFGSVELFGLEGDCALEQNALGEPVTRDRILVKTLGSIRLGDRYDGEIKYENGLLIVGPDIGWFARGDAASSLIPIS